MMRGADHDGREATGADAERMNRSHRVARREPTYLSLFADLNMMSYRPPNVSVSLPSSNAHARAYTDPARQQARRTLNVRDVFYQKQHDEECNGVARINAWHATTAS